MRRDKEFYISKKDEFLEKSFNQGTKNSALLLTLALATVAFVISKLLDKDFVFNNFAAAVFLCFGIMFELIATLHLLTQSLRIKNYYIKVSQFYQRIIDKYDNWRDSTEINDVDFLSDNDIATYYRDNVQLFIVFGYFTFFTGQLLIITGFVIQLGPKLLASI